VGTFVQTAEQLPFVKEKNFWAVTASGNWADDNRIGRQYAQYLVDYMQANSAPNTLGSVVRSMAGITQFTGIEAGFLTALGERACRP
jgi:hypothetical protein